MRRLFADTFYWVALLNSRDQWHQRVVQVTEGLGEHHLYTTDAVFTEYLAFYSARGSYFRQEAVHTVRRLLSVPHVTVIPQTREVFLTALDLYEFRQDKQYSLADCISMDAMRQEGLKDVLSNDHHFLQKGYTLLFP